MFGELDDSNIYESFDAFSDNSDGNNPGQEFSFGDSEVPADGAGDDFLDMSSYTEPSVQSGQQLPPEENGMPDMDDILNQPVMDGAVQDDAQQFEPQQTPAPAAGKGCSGMVFIVILVIIALAAGGLFYYKKFMAPASAPEQAAGDYFVDQTAQQAVENPPAQDVAAKPADENTATVDVNLEEPAAGENPEQAAQKEDELKAAQDKLENDKTLSNQERAELKKKIDEEKDKLHFGFGSGSKRVTIPVASGGRVDPFVPYAEKVAEVKAPKFDLIAPPADVPMEDPAVTEVVQTKISGIMYDSAKPSAIVNIGGSDYLVHKGDSVNGYQIMDITKNSVTIKYNSNIYQATVGEAVGSNIELNPVSNLSSKFGGAYNSAAKNAIQF